MPFRNTAKIVLLVILTTSLVNAAFNFAAVNSGLGFPYSTYLGPPYDRFGDFFKYALTYPGAANVHFSNAFGLHDLITSYAGKHYDTSDVILRPGGVAVAGATHYHSPPITTLFYLVSVRAMQAVDPVWLYVTLCALLVVYSARIAQLASDRPLDRLFWLAVLLLSYPTLFMFDRGNLPDGFTALLILHATLLANRGRAPLFVAVLLALAFNIRPNAVPFGLPALLFLLPHWRRFMLILGTATAVIFVACLWAAHALYPNYSLYSFGLGLQAYSQLFVVQDFGIGGGSSLYGALKHVLGIHAAQVFTLGLAAVVGLSTLLLWPNKRINRAELLFLVCSAYTLGSLVIGDYHLLIFAVVPILAANEPAKGWRWWLPVACSSLMLSPKNVLFSDGLSWQVYLNPFVLAASALVCIAMRSRVGVKADFEPIGEGLAVGGDNADRRNCRRA